MEQAAIYSRLSKNRGRLSNNCQIQIDEATEFAEVNNIEVVIAYAEDDVSASKYSTKLRPYYADLLQKIRDGRIEVIIVTEMTRLYRRMEELLALIELAETTNLKRIVTTDGQVFMLHSGEGRHLARAHVNNAILESDKISQRGKRKRRAMAKEGLPVGGARPFGYESNGMVPRPAEAAIVNEIADRIIAGNSTGAIVRDLHARGIKTSRDKNWTRPGIAALVGRKRNIGIRVHGADEYPAQWPPIATRPSSSLSGRGDQL
jgi:DNA invertase Pin-like site-specific DNA recombinase